MPGEEVDTAADEVDTAADEVDTAAVEVVGIEAVEDLDIAEVVEDTMTADTEEVAADTDEVADAELG